MVDLWVELTPEHSVDLEHSVWRNVKAEMALKNLLIS